MDDSPLSADEPTDPRVRQLLWRLRARLVAPPDVARAEEDLTRIVEAAREYAHEPIGVEHPDTDLPTPITAMQPDAERHADNVTPLQPRGLDRAASLGRVAAAVVMVVIVGGGIAQAVDIPAALQARFAGDLSADGVPADGVPPDPQQDVETMAAPTEEPSPPGDVSEPRPDLDAPDPADGVPSLDRPDDDAVDAGDDAEVDGSEPAEQPAPTEPTPRDSGQGGSSTGSGANGSGSSDAPSSSDGDDSAEADPEPPSDGADEVLAAPPRGGLDGFGGPSPCPEGKELADCIDEDDPAADEGATDEGDDVDDDASPGDGATGERDEAAEREALAKRRGGG